MYKDVKLVCFADVDELVMVLDLGFLIILNASKWARDQQFGRIAGKHGKTMQSFNAPEDTS